jgi:hypothetical protein
MAGDSAGGREVGRISIRVVPDLDKFYGEVKDRLEEIEHELKLHIKVVPDMDEFREKVDAATRDLKDAKVKVKTDLDRNGDLIKDLDEVGKNAHVKVKTDLDKSSLARTIGEAKLAAKAADVTIKVKTERRGGFLGGAANLLGSLKMPDVLPNFGGLGGAASAFLLVGALSLLAPALAMVSQAIVGLPALVSGLVLPIGVFALGLGGIKKALDESGILTETKGKKGKEKQGLGAALKEVQQQISDVFEKGFTPLFKQVGAVIPQLLRGLPFVAQGIVNATKGVVDALTNPALIAGFDRFTNSVGTMLTNLGPGLGSFATGMSNLIVNVGDHLPGLGTQMSAWADRFTNWVTKISTPKKDWFGGDLPNSSTLDKAVTNMKPILNSVVDFVGKLTEAGLAMAANPQMGDNIKKVVDGLGNFVVQVLPGLERFFGQVAHYMGNIKPPEVGPNGKPLPPDPNRPPPVDFDRVHSPSSKGFDHTWFGPSDGNLIPKAFRPDGLGGDLKAMRDWFTSHLKGFADNGGLGIGGALISSIFGGGAGPGGKANAAPEPFNPGKAVGQPPPTQQPQQPQKPVQSPKVDMNGISQSIQGGAGAIAAAANDAFKALSDAATVAVSQSVAAVQQLPGAVAQALSGLRAAGQAAGQALGAGMAAGIAAGAPAAIAAATALAQGVEAAAKTHLGIKSPSRVFHGLGQNTAQGFQNGLEGGFQGVLDSARNLSQQVTDAVANGTAGPELGKQVKEQIQAIDIEKQQLKTESDSTSDKGQKQAIKGQIDQLNIAKSQLGLSKDQLKTGGDSTKAQMDQLSIKEQQLKAEYDATSDKGKRKDLKAQMDALKVQKDQLKLYQMQHPESKDKKSDDMGQQLAGVLNKSVDIGKNFAMANVKQFESDIGISGNGALPQLADMGLNWMQSMLGNLVTGAMGGGKGGGTQIHVNSVDEAFAAKQNLDNKQAHQFAGR